MADYEDKQDAKASRKRTEDILTEAKERLRKCMDYEKRQRDKELDDLQFLDGEQWDPNVLNERRRDGRPALVVNRMDQFVQHITNAMRQNRIAARVFPVDDVADPDTAEILQGYLRHIEAQSDGDLVYGTAAFYGVASGRGYWINRTQYVSPLSFDTEIIMERVENPFQVYLDWCSRHPSGRDAKFGFKVCKYSKDEYEKEYEDSECCGGWDDIKDDDPFIDGDEVTVVEYWRINTEKDTLIRLADGTAALKSEIPEQFLEPTAGVVYLDEQGKTVERETGIETVEWFKLSPAEILEETVWPTQPEYCSIPIVKVVGNELDVNGRHVLKGIIRNLKDAQRQYNFMLSAQTEAIDSSKGQVVFLDGHAEGHEQEIADLSKRKSITVSGYDLQGRPLPPPGRLQGNASIAPMTEARLMAADDLKALTGIYDAALGNQSNETSGRAINSRQAQSDTANYHFTGNLVRSVNHSTRLILGAVPTVIDQPRTLRIFGQDDQQKVVKVNQLFSEGEGQPSKIYRVGGKPDGGVGKYDVVCEAGPSPSTMKEERAIRMTELVKVAPGLMNIAPDLILKDLGASHEFVERVKKSLPPELQDDQNKDKPPIPPEVQQQMQQMSQQLQMLTQELNAAKEELNTQGVQAKSKESIEQAKLAQQVQIEAARVALEREKLAFEQMKFQATLQADLAKHSTSLDSQETQTLVKVEADMEKAGMQFDAQKEAAKAASASEEIAE